MRQHVLFLQLLLAFLILPGSSYAQYGLSITNLEFSGTNAQVFKPAIVPQFSHSFSEIDDASQMGAKIGFTILATRQDTFFNYGLLSSQGTTVLPTYEIYEQVKYIPISIFYSYMPLQSSFRPVMGLAVNADLMFYNYQKEIETLLSSTEQNKEYGIIGLMPFLGGSYQFNEQFRCQLEVGRQFSIDTNRSWQNLWRTTLSVLYHL